MLADESCNQSMYILSDSIGMLDSKPGHSTLDIESEHCQGRELEDIKNAHDESKTM